MPRSRNLVSRQFIEDFNKAQAWKAGARKGLRVQMALSLKESASGKKRIEAE